MWERESGNGIERVGERESVSGSEFVSGGERESGSEREWEKESEMEREWERECVLVVERGSVYVGERECGLEIVFV